MDKVYEWIRSIVIYMILNTILMNLLGNSSYKKYIRVISGMILVLIVISPLLEFLKLDLNLDYYMASQDFAVETSDFENKLRLMEKQQMDEVFGEYQEKVKAGVGDMLEEEGVSLTDFQLLFDKDETSTSFGLVTGMNIKADIYGEAEEGKGKVKESFQIERIQIDSIEFSDNDQDNPDQPPSPLKIKLKNKLSNFYNIEPDNINISIQGG